MPQQIKTSEFSWCRTTPLLMSTSTFLGMYFASFLGIFGLFCSALPRHQSVSVHINVLWAVCQSKIPPDKGDLSKNPVHTKLHLWISSPWQEFSKSSVLSDLKCRLHLYRRPKHTEKSSVLINTHVCVYRDLGPLSLQPPALPNSQSPLIGQLTHAWARITDNRFSCA